MTKLPENFSLEKYGLNVRLVNEDDAEFILSLRANPNRTKYMKTLEDNIERQKEWIQEYKIREKEGLDYYFIYSNDEEKPIGLNRISHLDYNAKTCKISSLIAIEGLKYEALKMILIRDEIVFNLLDFVMLWGDVHEKNIKAIRIFKLFGFRFEDIGKEYYNITLTKNNFLNACKNSLLSSLLANEI